MRPRTIRVIIFHDSSGGAEHGGLPEIAGTLHFKARGSPGHTHPPNLLSDAQIADIAVQVNATPPVVQGHVEGTDYEWRLQGPRPPR